MSTGKPPPGTIPTLTEVVSWPDAPVPAPAPAPPAPGPVAAVPAAPALASPAAAAAAQAPVAPAAAPPSVSAPAPMLDEAQLVQRVLGDVQRQVDLMLEVRLREALAPILVRATDAMVRDARKELTAALREIVSTSVARELARGDGR